jgi:ribosome-associated protein
MADSNVSRPITKATPISVPQEELEFTFVRSSGAGGQNVNKVSSKAVLRWNPLNSRILTVAARERFLAKFGSKLTKEGDLIITSDRHRDQGRNSADCLEKLRAMIAEIARPPKARKATKPTFGSKQRRLKSKKEQSEKKSSRRWKDQ